VIVGYVTALTAAAFGGVSGVWDSTLERYEQQLDEGIDLRAIEAEAAERAEELIARRTATMIPSQES
jgi:hypothetical protein